MAGSMLSINSQDITPEKVTPHLLPCQIQHNGSVEPSEAFWKPSEPSDGKSTAYFRGRKLQGRTVALPPGYRGVIVEKHAPAEKPAPQPDDPIDVDAEDGGDEPELGNLHTLAEFDELVVWNHEVAVEASEDPYVRGMEEWIGLSHKIHSHSHASESKT